MIQLQVLSGKLAGSNIAVRQFPFVIGRRAGDSLQIDDEGVWESHVQIDYQRSEGFTVTRLASGLLLVNDEASESTRLKNGDVLGLGMSQIRFWLAPTRQKTMRVRDILTWIGLGTLFVAQIALIYWLL